MCVTAGRPPIQILRACEPHTQRRMLQLLDPGTDLRPLLLWDEGTTPGACWTLKLHELRDSAPCYLCCCLWHCAWQGCVQFSGELVAQHGGGDQLQLCSTNTCRGQAVAEAIPESCSLEHEEGRKGP